MRYQLNVPWPVGRWLVPQGTILDGADWTWKGKQLPWPPPLETAALDAEAYEALSKFYPPSKILFTPESSEPVQGRAHLKRK